MTQSSYTLDTTDTVDTLFAEYQEKISNAINIGSWNNVVKFICSINDNLIFYKFKVKCDTEFSTGGMSGICYDLHEVIFMRLNEEGKKKVLDHINSMCYQWQKQKITHIISDVDDTLFASKIGGIDCSEPKGKFFPGVIELHTSIRASNYCTLLSARPKFMKKYLCSNEYMGKLNKINVLSCHDSNGQFAYTGLWYTASRLKNKIKGRNENKLPEDKRLYKVWGKGKFKKFKEYKMIFPEYKMIFIGDSGQGDVITAKMIVNEFPSTICLIRNIQYEKNKRFYDELMVENYKKEKIYLFNDYLEASKILYGLNIMDKHGYDRIKRKIKK